MDGVFANSTVQQAIARVHANQAGLVILQNGAAVFEANTRGIRTILSLHDEQPELLRGAVIVDKIIGRAAAMILRSAGVQAIYGDVMSSAASRELEQAGIAWQAGTLTDAIINRQGDGLCPMEQTVLHLTDPAQALPALRTRVAELQRHAGSPS